MRHLFRRFRKGLVAVGLASVMTAVPAVAGVPGGSSNVNVNVTAETVNLTEINEIFNDVILASGH